MPTIINLMDREAKRPREEPIDVSLNDVQLSSKYIMFISIGLCYSLPWSEKLFIAVSGG